MMYLYDKEQWFMDLDTVSNILPELSELGGKTVLITGATGLIGSAVTDLLIRYNETHTGEQTIQIAAAGRSAEKMRKRFAPFCDRAYFRFVPYDALRTDNVLDLHSDYIIHGAGNAYPAKMTREPVESMLANLTGVNGLLEYAREQQAARLLYISSSEVYGGKDGDSPYREEDYGYVNLLNPRSSYPVAKRAAETLCVSYAEEYGVDAVIVRPGHVYGPTASSEDNRVSSAWAYVAARGEDLIMKSDGSQLRSYCYCADCASAIVKVLLRGERGSAYNISNSGSVVSIRELAECIAETAGVKVMSELPTERERTAFNPMQNASLNSEKLEALGWEGKFPIQVGVEHTLAIL